MVSGMTDLLFITSFFFPSAQRSIRSHLAWWCSLFPGCSVSLAAALHLGPSVPGRCVSWAVSCGLRSAYLAWSPVVLHSTAVWAPWTFEFVVEE